MQKATSKTPEALSLNRSGQLKASRDRLSFTVTRNASDYNKVCLLFLGTGCDLPSVF
jgi:hypothetical protein